MKKALLASALVVCVLGVFYYWEYMSHALPTQTISIGDTTLVVEVANTEATRQQGLSGRTELTEDTGMLFVFKQDDVAAIWMKDMHFPIDILWLDSTGTVITIAPNATPASYPNVFYPARPARYVLEVPAGFAAAHGVAEGSVFVLQ